jgi:hypothetical protein
MLNPPFGASSVLAGRERQRPIHLTGDAKGLSAGSEHPEMRARVKMRIHQVCRCLHEVLAVVHHEEQLFVFQSLH